MTRFHTVSMALLLCLGACSSDELPAETCGPELEPSGWQNRLRTPAMIRLGAPVHSVVDSIVAPDGRVRVEGKFAYGPTSADLEGERVALFESLGECEWRLIGETVTDSDGRAQIEFDAAGLAPGAHSVSFVVEGDGSSASGFVHVLEPDRPIVIFDIDGTLTTSDAELVDGIVLHHVGASSDELLDVAGSPLSRAQWLGVLDEVLEEDAEMWDGAVDIAHAYADAGIQVVYITGRPYLYDDMTRRWLHGRGLPEGPLVMVQDVLDALPQNVGAYKLQRLQQLRDRGHPIVAAYGNATTDICAYAELGLTAEQTFIIGPNAGLACEGFEAPIALESYTEHQPLVN